MDHERRPGGNPVVLEPLARAFVEEHRRATFKQGEGGRPSMRPHGGGPVRTPGTSGAETASDVVEETLVLPFGSGIRQTVRLLRPFEADEQLPVILYVPGPSWMGGGPVAQQAFERDLVLGADAAVLVFDLPPSQRECYPAAVESLHALASWVWESGSDAGLDPHRTAAVGVSTGANLVAALTLMAARNGSPPLVQQVLICPATDAEASTSSHGEFADGYVLEGSAVRHFWERYIPHPALRAESTASPLRAGIDELSGLPSALILVAEADVLRDEGEAYAARLRTADVPVVSLRYHGTIHGFVAFDVLRDSHASRAARIQIVDTLHVAFHTWGR